RALEVASLARLFPAGDQLLDVRIQARGLAQDVEVRVGVGENAARHGQRRLTDGSCVESGVRLAHEIEEMARALRQVEVVVQRRTVGGSRLRRAFDQGLAVDVCGRGG